MEEVGTLYRPYPYAKISYATLRDGMPCYPYAHYTGQLPPQFGGFSIIVFEPFVLWRHLVDSDAADPLQLCHGDGGCAEVSPAPF